MTYPELAGQLWNRLWQDYRKRVKYARVYQEMIEATGGAIANDHIAFRSLRLTVESNSRKINLGIPYLGTIAEKLGYTVAGEYEFPDQSLYALHYRHPDQYLYDLPKLFISELIVDALGDPIVQLIKEAVCQGDFANLEEISFEKPTESILEPLQRIFSRPWYPPKKSILEAVNSVSQYGAWVLLHGYGVNHFTGYINRQNTPKYPDIETTVQGLKDLGVPMKATIEGSRGSGLRQTATQAVQENVTVWEDERGELTEIPWTYAYYEIAERNCIEDGTGKKMLFEGFLNAQAKNLFEMTHYNS